MQTLGPLKLENPLMQPFSTQFVLTRDYLAESYDQSLPHGKGAKPNFLLPIAMLVAGILLLALTSQPAIAGWLLIALGVLELFHIRFRRAWWLFRQTFGKNNEIEISLTIDDEGICTLSSLSELRIAWSEIDHIVDTGAGVILVIDSSNSQYLSKSVIPENWLGRMLAIERSSSGN